MEISSTYSILPPPRGRGYHDLKLMSQQASLGQMVPTASAPLPSQAPTSPSTLFQTLPPRSHPLLTPPIPLLPSVHPLMTHNILTLFPPFLLPAQANPKNSYGPQGPLNFSPSSPSSLRSPRISAMILRLRSRVFSLPLGLT